LGNRLQTVKDEYAALMITVLVKGFRVSVQSFLSIQASKDWAGDHSILRLHLARFLLCLLVEV
jgi:hypothetical protein